MGFGDAVSMRRGLLATKAAKARTAGTITVDSYTRVGDLDRASQALANDSLLNGFPICSYEPTAIASVLEGVFDTPFPVQVRHGSAMPQSIMLAMTRAGLSSTEGGPVSYCLPYGRTPLTKSVSNWKEACEILLRSTATEPHLETFGGCLLGQLCPPELLVAMSLLEALFFVQQGIRSVSLSYAQQTSQEQDYAAIRALTLLAAEFLGPVEWHIVIYTYMGLYPQSEAGAVRLLKNSAELAKMSGAARLIVKSAVEAHRLPTIEDNVDALEVAAEAAAYTTVSSETPHSDSAIYASAKNLIESTLELHADTGQALLKAFKFGHLDVPYCIHPDNRGSSRSYIDSQGWLRWAHTGMMPIRSEDSPGERAVLTSSGLMQALSYMRDQYDSGQSSSREN